jgi:hypothetical protein
MEPADVGSKGVFEGNPRSTHRVFSPISGWHATWNPTRGLAGESEDATPAGPCLGHSSCFTEVERGIAVKPAVRLEIQLWRSVERSGGERDERKTSNDALSVMATSSGIEGAGTKKSTTNIFLTNFFALRHSSSR